MRRASPFDVPACDEVARDFDHSTLRKVSPASLVYRAPAFYTMYNSIIAGIGTGHLSPPTLIDIGITNEYRRLDIHRTT